MGWKVYVLTVDDDEEPANNRFDDVLCSIEGKRYITKPTNILDGVFNNIQLFPPIASNAIEMIRENDINYIFHTAGPFSPLLSTIFIKRFTDTTHIIDMRDAWSVRPVDSSRRTAMGRIFDYISPRMESHVFHETDCVIMTTKMMKNAYSQIYPSLSDKFKTIPNGYETERFHKYEPKYEEDFHIVCAGKFTYNGAVNAEPFIRAFKRFADNNRNVKFSQYGGADQPLNESIKKYSLGSRFSRKGFVNSDVLIPVLKGANVGLVGARSKTETATKLYEYMACNIPILYIGPKDSSAAELLQNCKHGYVSQPENSERIYNHLQNLYDKSPKKLGAPDLEKFHRKELAKNLAEILLNENNL